MEAYASYGMEPLPPPKDASQRMTNEQATTTVPEHLKKFIGKVRVYHVGENEPRTFVNIYDENVLRSISNAAVEELSKQSPNTLPKTLVVSNVDKAQLAYVLTAASVYGHKLRLDMSGSPMLEVIEILHVVETLDVMPPQTGVAKHLVGLLSHNAGPLPAQVMVNVHRYFGHKGWDSRPWRVMVHQMAYDIAHGKLGGDEFTDMEQAALPYFALHHAINERRQYLVVCLQHKEFEIMKGEAKMQKREFMDGKKSATKHRRTKQHSGEKKTQSQPFDQHSSLDKVQQKRFEEENGLRETSSRTAEYVMHEKPTGFRVSTKMSQREKKAAQRRSAQADSHDKHNGEGGSDDAGNAVRMGEKELGNRFGALTL